MIPMSSGRRKGIKLEALMWKQVPLEALQGVCGYTPAVEQQIENQIESRGLSFKVAVRQSWYF